MVEKKVLLETASVTKRFGGLTALDGVSTSVKEGEVRGIIGPNGAGKTTLFNVITGELKPSSGKIFLKREDVTDLPPYAICRKGLSRTFQLTLVFPEMTVLESVWVGVNSRSRHPWNPVAVAGKIAEARKKTEEICQRVGLWEKRNELAFNLSYGDQKVLEIAMALSTEPSVPPSGRADPGSQPEETDTISGVVERLSKRMTIVLIEHSMDVVLRLCH